MIRVDVSDPGTDYGVVFTGEITAVMDSDLDGEQAADLVTEHLRDMLERAGARAGDLVLVVRPRRGSSSN
jgi:hypothetical protein